MAELTVAAARLVPEGARVRHRTTDSGEDAGDQVHRLPQRRRSGGTQPGERTRGVIGLGGHIGTDGGGFARAFRRRWIPFEVEELHREAYTALAVGDRVMQPLQHGGATVSESLDDDELPQRP